jgi:hypothetical protein
MQRVMPGEGLSFSSLGLPLTSCRLLFVLAGLVPAIATGTLPLLMAGTSPAMTAKKAMTQTG